MWKKYEYIDIFHSYSGISHSSSGISCRGGYDTSAASVDGSGNIQKS